MQTVALDAELCDLLVQFRDARARSTAAHDQSRNATAVTQAAIDASAEEILLAVLLAEAFEKRAP